MRSFTKAFLMLLLCTLSVLTTQAKTEKVHATFENPSNTNTTWNAETKTFTWSTTYYNQLRNIGLPNGDITKYKKLVVDCTIKSGDQFRVLIYKGGSNKTLYASNGVNEFILADTLKALYPDDYNEFLLGCDEICLSGNNAAAPGEAVINDIYLETYDDEGEKVYATFENPSNTNTTWNSETKTFTWSTTYYNQLRNIGLPSGDITKYKKLVVDCTIKSGDQFRVLIYKGGSNKTLYASNGVNEFILADTLKALYPDDYNEFLKACDEICLSGNNAAAPGEAIINAVYLETYPENESVEIPDIVYEEDPGKPEGEFVDFTEAFSTLQPRLGLGTDGHPIVLGNGDVVVGQRTKDVIADLSAYSKLTMVTSPSLKLVVYMNHEVDVQQNAADYAAADSSKYVFLNVQSNENGIAEIDLTQYNKQDLNCIALPWDNNNKGTVWYLLLTKEVADTTAVATEATFDFNASNHAVSASGDTSGDITANEVNTVNDVVMTISPAASGTPNRYWGTGSGPQLRMYSGTMTLEAPEGKAITKVVINNGKWNAGNTFNGVIADKGEWEGNSTNVVLAIAGNTQMNSVVVTLADKNAETTTYETEPAPEPVHIANTAETAYTVAKAIELIDAGEALSETVFVKGIVSKVDEFKDNYKSITYWISEDGTTAGQQFECYSGKGINGADFNSIDDVEVGAEVVVTGTLKKFGDIYEFNQNNALVSYKAPAEPEQSWIAPTIAGEDPVTDGQYKVMNVGSGKYLAMGKAWFGWSTTAIVAEDGFVATFAGDAASFTLTNTGNGKYVFTSGNDIEGDAMHADGANATNYGLTKLANGNYRIHDAGGNEESPCWGYNSAFHATGIVAHANATAEGWNCEWIFVGDNAANLYNAKKALYDALVYAKANGVSTDEASAVYNNSEATIDDLKAAAEKLTHATNFAVNTANAVEGADMTYTIVNPSFETGNTTGWTYEASNDHGAKENSNGTYTMTNCDGKYLFNIWSSGNQISQTIEDLPNGTYKMTAVIATDGGQKVQLNANGKSVQIDAVDKGTGVEGELEFEVIENKATIGAEGVNKYWYKVDNFRLTFVKGIDLTDLIAAYEKALTDANAALAAEENAVVTGEERTALTAAIRANENVAQNQDSLTAAVTALNNATSAFTGAKGAYNALATAKTEKAAMTFAYAAADKKAAAEATLTAEATSAADATAKVEAITKAYRVYAESSALLEGVEGAQNMTDAILNPQAENEVNNWTTVLGEGSGGSIGIRDNEPWTDGADNATHKYFDGGNWGAQAWDVALEQKIALPKGKYQLTVKSRASADVEFTLYAGNNTAAMPAIGASNGLFNRGWNDSSVEFELTEADSIAIGVRGVTSVVHNWMSFSDFRLMQFPAEVEPEPIDPDLVEIPQDQQDQEAGVVTLATFEKDEKTGVTTYTTKDNVCVIFKMKNVDVSNCDYILFKFAEPTPTGLKYAFWTNNKNNDLPAGVTEFKYVFAEDNENEIKDGIIPEVSLLTIFAEAGKVVKVKGVYKHKIPVAPVEITRWDFTKWSEATVANLKADAAASKVAGWSDVEKKADAEADADPTEASKDNCFWATIAEGGELTANGAVIEELKGLKFDAAYTAARSLAIAVNYPETTLGTYNGPAYLWLGGKQKVCFTIPAVKPGSIIKIGVESHKPAEARGIQLFVGESELTDPEGNTVAAPTTYTEQLWQVPAGEESVDVVVKNTNGCHIYFIDLNATAEAPLEKHTFEGYVAVATTLQGDVQGDVTTAPQTVTLEETETDNVIAVTFSGFSSTIPPVNFSEFTFNATIDADETLTKELYEVAANSKVTGTNGTMTLDYTITGNGSATADSIPTFALKLNQNPMMTINVVFAATAEEAKAALLKTTGIINIARDAQKNVIYNLNGQKVNKAQKGLYIINGKKVFK